MYHYEENGQPRGPVPLDELRGRITAATLVWREGLSDWRPAGEVPELAELFATSAMVEPSVTPPPVAAPAPMMAYETPTARLSPSGLSIASMVMGILGLMLSCFYLLGVPCSILALVFGYIARRQAPAPNDPSRGFATAGIVMGWILLGLVAVFVAVVVVIAIIAAATN